MSYGNTMINYYSWDRNAKYNSPNAPLVTPVIEDPDTRVSVWSIGALSSLSTSIIADKEHQEYISTESAPGVAPNLGAFFCPILYCY